MSESWKSHGNAVIRNYSVNIKSVSSIMVTEVVSVGTFIKAQPKLSLFVAHSIGSYRKC